ncbi:hypothetical protein HDU78_006039 [Chytriomyces hyalinus]|nr:hypothetical protein HDU78_006039 [Chytriomyces hyalinus]
MLERTRQYKVGADAYRTEYYDYDDAQLEKAAPRTAGREDGWSDSRPLLESKPRPDGRKQHCTRQKSYSNALENAHEDEGKELVHADQAEQWERTLPNNRPQVPPKSVSTLVEKAKPMARVTTEPSSAFSSNAAQKVLTAAAVKKVDQQQETGTIMNESVNGNAEEDVPEFASFSRNHEVEEAEETSKATKSSAGIKRSRSTKSVTFFETTAVIPVSKEEEGDGRIKRARLPPVQFWKLNAVKHESRPSPIGKTFVPCAIGVTEKEPEDGKKASGKLVQKESPPGMHVVMDYETKQEVEQRRVFYHADMLQPQLVRNGDIVHQRTFLVGDFCASGVLILPKGTSKPNKATESNALNTFEVGQGAHFLVPRGNQYSLENIGSTDTTLYFIQCRDPSDAVDTLVGQASSSNANSKPKTSKKTPATPKKAKQKAAVSKKTAVKEPAPKPGPSRKGRGKQG